MFVVVTARAVPEHLRGYLSRFLTEVSVGTYVGNTSPVVADRLWMRCEEANVEGGVVMVNSSHVTEQGFEIRASDSPRYVVDDHDGILLVGLRATSSAVGV